MYTQLINKYNKPVPRYTSYPTVPYWTETAVTEKQWLSHLNAVHSENPDEGISLYIHLPFCESLCTYCGCNKRITKNHKVESPYIDAVKNEWKIYQSSFTQKPTVKYLHLGGGTPTFFSPESLRDLLQSILKEVTLAEDFAFSFEGHPNNTTKEHLAVLASLGFDRVSYGIQDFDLTVQRAINRIQPLENVRNAVKWARELGYSSINFDLVYGLPFQTIEALQDTIEKIKEFKPERIALYSYAHVPWKSKSQRGYDESNLPGADDKLYMYTYAKEMLTNMGYHSIGMDHFALEEDELTQAVKNHSLNRNFMGYTTDRSEIMIGLGCSAISSTGKGFVQNEKVVETYQNRIGDDSLPLTIGHFSSEEEIMVGKVINQIICLRETSFFQSKALSTLFEKAIYQLQVMEEEGLLELEDYRLKVTEKGMLFVRNICSLFDPKLYENNQGNMFSKAV
jgi:oxygen-independent coproporphyrinogen-3 oxidase